MFLPSILEALGTPGAFFVSLLVRTGGRVALMRINIWIVLVVLIALLAITRYAEQGRNTQRICADEPTASVCHR
jgi:hypothetical protein